MNLMNLQSVVHWDLYISATVAAAMLNPAKISQM